MESVDAVTQLEGIDVTASPQSKISLSFESSAASSRVYATPASSRSFRRFALVLRSAAIIQNGHHLLTANALGGERAETALVAVSVRSTAQVRRSIRLFTN